MKFLNYFLFLPISILILIYSCNKSDSSSSTETSGNWVTRNEFDGNARAQAVCFTIGDTAYLGTGYDGVDRLNDFWSFDSSRLWKQVATFTGAARNSAAAFSVGRNGYVTTGTDGNIRFSDTYEYNSLLNKWTKKADCIGADSTGGISIPFGSARYGATGFSIGSKGYITCGYDGSGKKDLLEYDPVLDKWTAKTSFGGSRRYNATVFVYKNEAYVFSGLGTSGNLNDFYKYTPSTDKWTALRKISNVSTDTYDDDYTDIIRNGAVAFVLGDKGYLTCGVNGGYTNKTWEYDFLTDTWARKTAFERQSREGAIAFTIDGKGYVSLGKNSSYYLYDLEEFLPNATYDSND